MARNGENVKSSSAIEGKGKGCWERQVENRWRPALIAEQSRVRLHIVGAGQMPKGYCDR